MIAKNCTAADRVYFGSSMMLCSLSTRMMSYQDIIDFVKFLLVREINCNNSTNVGRQSLETNSDQLISGKRNSKRNPHDQKDLKNSDLEPSELTVKELLIGEHLGAGGFGAVFAATWRGKRYALKKLHVNFKNERAARESYEAESSVLHLNHPNIVRTLFTFSLNNSSCILMEYVSRRTLQHVIDDPDVELNIKRRLRFALDISKALSYAHEMGIAHLDVKPANVLVTDKDTCKLGDFGCCQPVGPLDSERPASPTKSNLTGTYAYRAPELWRGDCPSPKSDIYSLGICLWQMLVREKPYGAQNHHVVIFGVVAYHLRPCLPEGLHCEARYKLLMEKCWGSNPTKRPSALELTKFVQLYLDLLD